MLQCWQRHPRMDAVCQLSVLPGTVILVRVDGASGSNVADHHGQWDRAHDGHGSDHDVRSACTLERTRRTCKNSCNKQTEFGLFESVSRTHIKSRVRGRVRGPMVASSLVLFVPAVQVFILAPYVGRPNLQPASSGGCVDSTHDVLSAKLEGCPQAVRLRRTSVRDDVTLHGPWAVPSDGCEQRNQACKSRMNNISPI